MRTWCPLLLLACNGRNGPSDTCDKDAQRTFYADYDGDMHGDPLAPLVACDLPEDASTTDDDCDDTDSNRWRGVTAWVDLDGDGYGAGADETVCEGEAGYVVQDGDCDDQEGSVHPYADATCGDAIDQDCDGATDCTPAVGSDEVSETASTRIDGGPGSATGTAVAGLGDLNQDGFLDVAVGAPERDPWGGAYVYYGPLDPVEDPDSADVAFSTVETDPDRPSIQAGSSFLTQDITGDGAQDLLIGAGDGDRFAYGYAVFVASTPLAPAIVLNDGASTMAILSAGADVLRSGVDLCGDESPDLLSGGGGGITLYCGPITAGGEASDLYQGGLYSDTYLSETFGDVFTLGDIDGDGTQDVVAGATDIVANDPVDDSAAELGGVYLFTSTSDFKTSSASKFNDVDDLSIYGLSDGARFGAAVSSPGDLDGDGYDDLYVGAPGARDASSEATGAVYYYAGATLAGQTREARVYADLADLTFYGGREGDRFGETLLTGLSVEQSQTLVVGAPGVDDETGAVGLWYSQPSPGDTLYDADYRLSGSASGDRFGAALANAGDTNGLGWDDLIIGAPGATDGAGAAWVMVFDQL